MPGGEWIIVSIYEFARKSVSTASALALIGNWPFRENEKFIDDFCVYFKGAIAPFIKLPKFLNPKVFEARERLTTACIKHLKSEKKKPPRI
jgi:hypothetical protein